MTVIQAVPPRAAEGPTVGDVLADVADLGVEVLCAPGPGLSAAAHRIHICDRWEPDDLSAVGGMAEGDVVLVMGLVTGPGQISHLVAAAARHRVAAVAVRHGAADVDWARREAEHSGVTILVVPRDVPWDQVHARVRMTLATVAGGWSPVADGGGDLFSLADTAAVALGGPVEIDDAGLRLLAFSDLAGDIDQLRTVSILTRRPPEDFLRWFRDSGQLHRLRQAESPVRIDPPGSRSRLAMPLRAGIDLLGYVWVAEGEEPFGPRHEAVLPEVARRASLHLAHLASYQDSRRRGRRDALARALAGEQDPSVLAALLGRAVDVRFAVVGLRPRAGWRDPVLGPLHVRDQLELRRELGTGAGGVACVVDGHVYLAVPVSGGAGPRPEEFVTAVREVVRYVSRHLRDDLVALVVTVPQPLAGLADVRTQVEQGLRIVAEDPNRVVATGAELRARVALATLGDLAGAIPHLTTGPVQVLADVDRDRGTDYVTTLQAYFDAGSDLSKASRLLFVHRNTLRYRLRRIQELCGLDLDDPVERLVAEFQLRLLRERRARPAA